METNSHPTRYYATNLAAILEEQGRRKDWLASEAGISPALVTLLLSGERRASEEVARRIAKALGVPLFLAFDVHNRRDIRPISIDEKVPA